MRIGSGFDVHAFGPGSHVMLAGIRVPHSRGVIAHSDGDVVLHALCDALLGAAGLGDIGSLFPSDDPELKGVSSVKLLREAYAQVRKRGYELVNADVVLIGQEPKIAPMREQMQSLLAGALDVDQARVSVRATTTDGLGFTGRGEGLAAQAVALLQSSSR